MGSVAPIELTHAFASDPSPQAKVNAASLDAQLLLIVARFNALLTALQTITRSDDQLANNIVRLVSLHPEVRALIEAAGLQILDACTTATTADVDLATGGLLTAGDVVTTEGMRVLVKAQADETENGLYLASSGAWVRTDDFDAAGDITGQAAISVLQGSQAGTWVLVQASPEIGTDALTFTRWGTTEHFGAAYTVLARNTNSTGEMAETQIGALTVLPTGASARRSFADRFSDEIWVEDYGATGDGVTNDKAAIDAALTAAIAANKTLRIGPGTFVYDGATASFVGPGRVIGAGAYATTIEYTSSGRISLSSGSWVIQGVTIEDTGGLVSTLLSLGSDCAVRDCRFVGGVVNGLAITGDDNLVSGCIFEGQGAGSGLDIGVGADRVTVDGCRFDGSAVNCLSVAGKQIAISNCIMISGTTRAIVATTDARNVVISGCAITVASGRSGMSLACPDSTVTGCRLDGTTGATGIHTTGAGAAISGCHIDDFDIGIHIAAAGATVDGCRITAFGSDGVYADGANASISGCTIESAAGANACVLLNTGPSVVGGCMMLAQSGVIGVQISSDRATVTGNALIGSAALTGILCSNNDCVIDDNNITGFTTAISNSGTGCYISGPGTSVFVRASSDAAQVLTTPLVTLAQFEDEVTDTHNAWATNTFTVPLDGRYHFSVVISTTSTSHSCPAIYVDGGQIALGNHKDNVAAANGTLTITLRLTAGQTVAIRWNASGSETRTSSPASNHLTIARVAA